MHSTAAWGKLGLPSVKLCCSASMKQERKQRCPVECLSVSVSAGTKQVSAGMVLSELELFALVT